jgi:hypothetical protein
MAGVIAQDDKRCAALERDEVEEIATDVARRAIGAGQGIPGYLEQVFGNEDSLEFAVILELLFHEPPAATVRRNTVLGRAFHRGEKRCFDDAAVGRGSALLAPKCLGLHNALRIDRLLSHVAHTAAAGLHPTMANA